jgi:hypothetical protein
VSSYNEEMKTEIAITRRATYKVEEALTQLGKTLYQIKHRETHSTGMGLTGADASLSVFVCVSVQRAARRAKTCTSTHWPNRSRLRQHS